ncbi:putative chitinase [Microsporum ferrugineum]
MQDSDEKFMPRLTALKNYNPNLQVWIAIGGWSMNDPDQPTKRTFSELAASSEHQKAFAKSLLSFMDKYGFDGVDIDWEYPVAEERSGAPEDFANYVSFLKNLRGYLGTKGLSITLPASYWYLQHFDIKGMEQYIDWFNMMSYDLHGTWDGSNPYLGAYVNAHTNITEIDTALNLLWRNKIEPEKVIMGMGFYGRSFTLADPSCKTAGCGFHGGGNPGKCSASAGTLMYSEIQDIIAHEKHTSVTDKDAAVKVLTWGGNQWVSYDDEETLRMKADYANKRCLGGVMVWAASTDDRNGTAIRALSKAQGRNNVIEPMAAKAADPSKCAWGECGASCPAGLVPVTNAKGNKDALGFELGCNGSKKSLCCPAKDAPKCQWKGSAPFCAATSGGKCNDNEIEIAATTDGCWTGHKSLCCSKTGSDDNFSACKWFGTAPVCAGKASVSFLLGGGLLGAPFSFSSYGCKDEKDKPLELTTGKEGEGGQKPCLYDGGFKSYCCPNPAPWKNCKWRSGHTTWTQWADLIAGPFISLFVDFSTDCKTGCEPGEVVVATDSFGCRSGTYSYFCCEDPNHKTPPKVEYTLCYGPTRKLKRDPDSTQNNVFLESSEFEAVCPSKSDHYRRDAANTTVASAYALHYDDADDSSLALGARGLVALGVRDTVMKLCAPGPRTYSIYTQNNPGASSIFRFTNAACTTAKQGLCAAAGIKFLTSLDPAIDWVAEHVFEKQEFRNIVQSMVEGVTAAGNTIRAGAAPHRVFDSNGIFQQNWPAGFPNLQIAKTWAGNINDAFTGILGRTSDAGLNNAYIANLQVCDADFNAYKDYVVAGSKFVSDQIWDISSETDKVGILTDFVDSFSYRSDSAVVASYNTAYKGLIALWDDFGKVCSASNIHYDWVDAFKQATQDNLKWQVAKAKTHFITRVDEALTVWNTNAAGQPPAMVKEMVDRLTDFKTNVGNYIKLPINQMAP